jgi:hypothetical protein
MDRSEEGRQFHEANSQARRQDLAQQHSTDGRSVEVTQARLRVAESMARNLREGRLQVGMVVCHKRST